MVDRTAGPSMAAKRQLVRETAGTAKVQQVEDANARLKNQPKLPRDAELLIRTYRWLTYELAGTVLRERESRQPGPGRPARGYGTFLLGAALGAVVAVVVTRRF